MNFEELDDTTRRYMLAEFEQEEASGTPYRGKGLSVLGRTEFADLIRKAIQSGNEEALAASLTDPRYWEPTETYVRDGVARQRKVNLRQAAERLGLTEFNTWYVPRIR